MIVTISSDKVKNPALQLVFVHWNVDEKPYVDTGT